MEYLLYFAVKRSASTQTRIKVSQQKFAKCAGK